MQRLEQMRLRQRLVNEGLIKGGEFFFASAQSGIEILDAYRSVVERLPIPSSDQILLIGQPLRKLNIARYVPSSGDCRIKIDPKKVRNDGNTLTFTMAHEFGHHVTWLIASNPRVWKDFLSQLGSFLGNNPNPSTNGSLWLRVMEEMSPYSKTLFTEFLAECVAFGLENPGQSQIADGVFRLMQTALEQLPVNARVYEELANLNVNWGTKKFRVDKLWFKKPKKKQAPVISDNVQGDEVVYARFDSGATARFTTDHVTFVHEEVVRSVHVPAFGWQGAIGEPLYQGGQVVSDLPGMQSLDIFVEAEIYRYRDIFYADQLSRYKGSDEAEIVSLAFNRMHAAQRPRRKPPGRLGHHFETVLNELPAPDMERSLLDGLSV